MVGCALPNDMTVGMIRVRNEGRWIDKVVCAIRPLCDRIFILDDHSTDATVEICRREGCAVLPSPFSNFNESRDMQFLFEHANADRPGWIISIDGDEELDSRDVGVVRQALDVAVGVSYFTLWIQYLWDRPDQRRVDGVYANFRRKRIFKPEPGAYFGGGIHYGGAGYVSGLTGGLQHLNARLRHYGYLHREDRLRKYAWHNDLKTGTDPNNAAEDCYRHIIQGDIPEIPAGAKLLHAGPLTFEEV